MSKFKKKKINFAKAGSLFILFLMVFSLVGFAFIISNESGTTTQQKDLSNGNLPNNLKLQQRQLSSGQNVWIAVKNGILFEFSDPQGLEQDIIAKAIANKIETKSFLNIYINRSFNSSGSLFLLERVLKARKIAFSFTNNDNCKNNMTLVLTNDFSFNNNKCIIFVSSNKDAYKKMNAIVLNLIKN